jgi:cell division septation protein DedD
MASRDSQTVLLSRQAILLVTAVGVGLLTLCYVLGVQVGKQSAALRRPLAKGAGEELEELPATMADQLKALEQTGTGAGFAKPQKAPEAKPEPPKPAEAPAKKTEGEGHWTLQLVSTPDAKEAKTVTAKAKAAGFKTDTLSEKGLLKVRLTGAMERKAADASLLKLRNHGFKPFAIKVD